MKNSQIIQKLIEGTLDHIYVWQPYKNNTFKFKAKSLELTQHFNPKTSFILSTKQGVFLLASYRAMSFPDEIIEEIALYFYPNQKLDQNEHISSNSSSLFSLRKIIELTLENVTPIILNDESFPNEDKKHSEQLNDFFKE